jgi:hypothetical protein
LAPLQKASSGSAKGDPSQISFNVKSATKIRKYWGKINERRDLVYLLKRNDEDKKKRPGFWTALYTMAVEIEYGGAGGGRRERRRRWSIYSLLLGHIS